MLKVENLTCGYGSQSVLKDINFNVERGQVLGIVGPNGSGKTTFIRAVTGIIKLMTGTIKIDAADITKMTAKKMSQKVAVVSQNIEASYMTVEEFILLGRIPYYGKWQFFETNKDLEIVEQYIQLTGLQQLRNHSLSEISGGERQLAMIARALCQETKLILLDEPTAHLDISHQSQILDLIRGLKNSQGITVVIVLHDLNLASEYCDSLALVDKGILYSYGKPQQVLTYQNIEKVYNTKVIVKENPVSKKPHVFLVSKDSLNNG